MTKDDIRKYNESIRAKNEAKKIIDGLNENEKKVLDLLIESSAGNGHDFGCIEDVTEVEHPGLSKHQIAGYLSVLQKKRLLDIDPTEKLNLGENSVTCFQLSNAVKWVNRTDYRK